MQVFLYEGNKIRTVIKNGEPWWVLKDLCAVLDISNNRDAAVRLDEDEKDKAKILDAIGRYQNTTVISESGLYTVILLSRKPEAKKFKLWIAYEVLPLIRKHGAYVTELEEMFNDPDSLIERLTERAAKHDLCKETIAISIIAKDYGKSGKWLNEYLNKLGIQFKQGDIWILYKKYVGYGYTRTKTFIYTDEDGECNYRAHTYWTQKGRLFIYDLLSAKGINPLHKYSLYV